MNEKITVEVKVTFEGTEHDGNVYAIMIGEDLLPMQTPEEGARHVAQQAVDAALDQAQRLGMIDALL